MSLDGSWETFGKLLADDFSIVLLLFVILTGCPQVSAQPWMPAPTPCSGSMPSGCWGSRQYLGIFSASGWSSRNWVMVYFSSWPVFALAGSTCKCVLSCVRPFCGPKGAGKLCTKQLAKTCKSRRSPRRSPPVSTAFLVVTYFPCATFVGEHPSSGSKTSKNHQHHQHHPTDSDQLHSCSIIFPYLPVFSPAIARISTATAPASTPARAVSVGPKPWPWRVSSRSSGSRPTASCGVPSWAPCHQARRPPGRSWGTQPFAPS